MEEKMNNIGWEIVTVPEEDTEGQIDDLFPGANVGYWRREIERVVRKRQRHIDYLREHAATASDYADRLEAQLNSSAGRKTSNDRERTLYGLLLIAWKSAPDSVKKFAGALGISVDWVLSPAFVHDYDASPLDRPFRLEVPITRKER